MQAVLVLKKIKIPNFIRNFQNFIKPTRKLEVANPASTVNLDDLKLLTPLKSEQLRISSTVILLSLTYVRSQLEIR